MTDNDIIKALSSLSYAGHSCANCKYDNGKGTDRCGLKGCKIARNALDLINRQKAEIERLQIEVSKLKKEMSYMINPNTIGDRHEMGCW